MFHVEHNRDEYFCWAVVQFDAPDDYPRTAARFRIKEEAELCMNLFNVVLTTSPISK